MHPRHTRRALATALSGAGVGVHLVSRRTLAQAGEESLVPDAPAPEALLPEEGVLGLQDAFTPDGLPAEPVPYGTPRNPPLLGARLTPAGVNTLTGSFSIESVDLQAFSNGPMPIFIRAYNSNDWRVTPLGPGWTHRYHMHLAHPGDGSGRVVLVGPLGRSDLFVPVGDGTHLPPKGVRITLVRRPDGTYVATNPDHTTWTFAANGRLVAIADRYGLTSAMRYNEATGQLVGIARPQTDLEFLLDYDPSTGRLVRVADWSGRSVQYEYDDLGRLVRFLDPLGHATSYGYHGNTHWLTTITDVRGITLLTNSYDAEGRVIEQQNAGGARTNYEYNHHPDGTGTTTVLYPPSSHDPTWRPREVDSYSPLPVS